MLEKSCRETQLPGMWQKANQQHRAPRDPIKDKRKLESIRINMKKNDSKNVYTKIENAIKEII